jgi:hypothetical protein
MAFGGREDHLARKGAMIGCPACGRAGTWLDPGDAVAFLPVLERPGDEPELSAPGGRELMPMTCGNCGYVRFHDTGILES